MTRMFCKRVVMAVGPSPEAACEFRNEHAKIARDTPKVCVGFSAATLPAYRVPGPLPMLLAD
eukprot:3001972-Lingulodinium_polyedra.AAC.1